jgi:predicted RNase H-like nuclease
MEGIQQTPTISKNAIGRYQVDGVRQIALRSPADLERVVGVLLGKRFAIKDLQRVLEASQQSATATTNVHLADNAKGGLRLEEQIRHLHKMDGTKVIQIPLPRHNHAFLNLPLL